MAAACKAWVGRATAACARGAGLAVAVLVLTRDGRGSAIGGRVRARCWQAGALRGSQGVEKIVQRPRVGGVLTVTNDLF